MDRSHSAAPRIASVRATHIAVNAESPVWGVAVLLCVLTTGAYNYAMSNNYNRVPRPALVMVADGKARLAVRRQTIDDLLALEL